MGTPVFFRRRNWSKEYARELYDLGYSDRQIAFECEVQPECIREWRRQNNLHAHVPSYKEEEKKRGPTLAELEMEARKHGMSYGEYMVAIREGKV